MSPLDLSTLLAVPDITCPTFASDGCRLAFISSTDGSLQAWELDLTPRSQPRRVTTNIDRVLSLAHAPAGPWLLVAHDHQGDERMQLTLIDSLAGETRDLTTDFPRCRHLAGGWAPDGQSFLFAANRRRPDIFDLYHQPIDNPQPRLVWQNEEYGGLQCMHIAPDGRRAAFVRCLSDAQHDLFEIDLATCELTQLNEPGSQIRFRSLAYTADGQTLIACTDVASDTLYLAMLDRPTRTWQPLTRPTWDVTSMAVSRDGSRLAYVVNEGGISRLVAHDLSAHTDTPAPATTDAPAVITGLAISSDGQHIACTSTTANQGAELALWNPQQHEVQPIHAPGVLQSESHDTPLPVPELITFPTFDGREIPAWYYRPPWQTGDQPRPAVVFVHGGPESQYLPSFDPFAQYLVQRGYGYLATNVRGSSGYGKTYAHLDDKHQRFDAVEDLAYAARWLKAQPEINADRIAVYGRSYGGFMTLAAMVFHPQHWAAGVNVVGISNFVSFLENTSAYRRANREAEYGSLAEDRDFLEKISPLNHIDKIQAPLLVIHGENDPRVPVTEARQLVAALQARQMPVKLLVFDDEGHVISKRENKLASFEAMAQFLDHHLDQP